MDTRTRASRPPALLLLLLWASLSCQAVVDPEPPASAAPAGLGSSGSRLQHADVDAGDASLGQTALDVIDWMEKAKDLKDYVDHYNQCAGSGFQESGCTARDMVWRGVCLLIEWKLGDMLLFDPGIPYGALCNGEPPLKCCKYEPSQESCHSAFNSDAPINCEGNWTMPLAESFGPCIPANRYEGDPGCYCDYIPICGYPVVERTLSQQWRYNQLGVQLAMAIEQVLLRQRPAEFIDYVGFVGFRAHRQVFLQGAPFARQDTFPEGYAVGEAYHTNDNDPDARYLRALTTLAVQRVFAGIPNVQARWSSILSRTWTEAEKADYLAGVPDPDGTLAQCVGAFGLEMLKQAHPEGYQLLAVPLEGETSPSCPAGWMGGAAIGAAPTLTVTASVAGSTVTLAPTVSDPNASDNPEGAYVVQIDWGDGRVEGRVYLSANPSTHSYSHAYEVAGTYSVSARVLNTSGLMGEATAQVSVLEGSGQPVPRSIQGVQLQLEASVNASTHGRIRVDVSATDIQGKVHSLGYHWVELVGASGTLVTVPLTGPLLNGDLKDIQTLRLKPSHYDGSGVSLRTLKLWGVTLTPYASPGMTPSTVSHALTNRDVKVYATGASVPTAPLMEPDSGKLLLPLVGAEIVIALPTGTPPGPEVGHGCRPVYGTDAPLMRTAGGGCEDLESGLVFAPLPSRMSWNDAVWDSALAGSPAPDADDHGRLNDYPGGYPVTGPDASPASHCHALVQGGQSDWRLPSEEELLKVASTAKAGTYFPYATDTYAWSSTSWDATYAVLRHLQSGSRSYGVKASGMHATLCVRSPPPPAEHTCLVPADGERTFVSSEGGCRDTRPLGLVWSKASVPPKSWYGALWGSELAGNAQPDAADGSRANDYAGEVIPGSPDSSTENYCHERVEGGFSDWRMPTEAELRGVKGTTLAKKYFGFNTAEVFWSADTSSSSSYGTTVNLSVDSGGTSLAPKTNMHRVVCVRAPETMAGPNLAPTGFTAPGSAVTRQTVSFTWTVTNTGTLEAPPTWRDAVYLSRDAFFSQGDTLLVDAPRDTLLAVGASYSVTKSVALPGVPAGAYYLLFRTDSTRTVAETDDANNEWAASAFTVTNPDLTPTAFTGPSAADVRQPVSLSWTVNNPGSGAALPSWYDYVYLSADTTYDSGDTLVTYQARSTELAAGASYTVTKSVAMPNAAAGSYYLLLRTDSHGSLYESNETNNVFTALPLTLTNPDLAPSAFTGPSAADVRETVSLSWTVSNAGPGTAWPNWSDSVYLSTDTTYGSGDTLVTSQTRSTSLAMGASYTVTKSVALPGVPAGSYYLLLRTDHGGALLEGDETNNQWTALPLTLTTADLVAGDLSAPPSARAGASITVSWSVTNGSADGEAHPGWYDYVYLSTDTVCCGGDTVLTYASRSVALAPGASYPVSKTVTVPSTLAPGSYQLILSVDRNNALYESNEGNNVVTVPFTLEP